MLADKAAATHDSDTKIYDFDSIRLKLEMLVRAYDPCVSCSTHMLDVQFVR